MEGVLPDGAQCSARGLWGRVVTADGKLGTRFSATGTHLSHVLQKESHQAQGRETWGRLHLLEMGPREEGTGPIAEDAALCPRGRWEHVQGDVDFREGRRPWTGVWAVRGCPGAEQTHSSPSPPGGRGFLGVGLAALGEAGKQQMEGCSQRGFAMGLHVPKPLPGRSQGKENAIFRNVGDGKGADGGRA